MLRVYKRRSGACQRGRPHLAASAPRGPRPKRPVTGL